MPADISDPTAGFLTPAAIAAYKPYRPTLDGGPSAMEAARHRMIEAGQWNDEQHMGRRWPIGCVALEVTQRCNLDCTLCYLSESAESIHDLPLPELFRRIETIALMYGPNTDVQITGGDPTLRKREDLVAVVRHIQANGMRPTLFTNGIRATREFLSELAAAGLVDVAFHVDMTQRRAGYASESELNEVRREYIGRARGLGLSIMFNTTVFSGNFHEIAELGSFFVSVSEDVSLASFQLQANTGRGVDGERPPDISLNSVTEVLRAGAGTALTFGSPSIGHQCCNRYAMALVCNGRAYDFYRDRELMRPLLSATAAVPVNRQQKWRAVLAFVLWGLLNPAYLPLLLRLSWRQVWCMRKDLIAARGRLTKISFFIHNFMSARRLEKGRIDACVFMVETEDGPISMCLHNARRDDFVLKSIRIGKGSTGRFWNPISGEETDAPGSGRPALPGPKRAKGRARLAGAIGSC
jgi:hypothetical protein